MCADCMMSVCSSRCPNAPEPKSVYTCCMCGYGIFEGDKYFDGPEGYVCETCIDDMSSKEFMEMIGEKFSIAKKEEQASMQIKQCRTRMCRNGMPHTTKETGKSSWNLRVF